MHLPSLKNGLLVGGALVALAIGGSPLLVAGADHLDAPALGGLTDMNGDFAPHSEHGNRDINDIYAFQGSDASRTVLAMTTNPAINLFGGRFGTNVRYIIKVDTTGDAYADLAYVWRFGPKSNGVQHYTVKKYTGSNARTLATGTKIADGWTESNVTSGNVKTFAGHRSDPFFFDLTGFVGTVFGIGTDQLGDDPTDFFENLNTNALVLEVPDSALGGGNIGVWGVTTYWDGSMWAPGDRMGRPAINTVFNNKYVDSDPGRAKDRFNRTNPTRQRTAYGGEFRSNIIGTLTNINGLLGTNCDDYDAEAAAGIADLLLPDMLTYNVTMTADFSQLQGRKLQDDVIDFELGLTTNGCVTSDGVGMHDDYLSTFPYLGVKH
jgi:hypothetical protein